MKTLLKKRPIRYAPVPEAQNNWDSIRVISTKLHRANKRTKVVIIMVFFFIVVFWRAMFSAQVDQQGAYYQMSWRKKMPISD